MDARWERARSILAALGKNVHHVDDERAFESIMYLTSPFPIVLRRAMTDSLAGVLSRRGIDGRWRSVAERVLWDALLALASAPDKIGAVDSNVTTPGGVTAAGLQEVGGLTRAAEDILHVMMRHGERLSDPKGQGTETIRTNETSE
jgi:pyrroline-5-carboxylate reductase